MCYDYRARRLHENTATAQADLGELEAKVAQSKAEWNRARVLRPMKAIADTDYDLDEANWKVAVANLEVGKVDGPAMRGGPGNGPAEPRLLHHQITDQRRDYRSPRQHRADRGFDHERDELLLDRQGIPDAHPSLVAGQRGRHLVHPPRHVRHVHRRCLP